MRTHSVESALAVSDSAVSGRYFFVFSSYRIIVSYTADISIAPVVPCPVDTIGSRPEGSENSANVRVPPVTGVSGSPKHPQEVVCWRARAATAKTTKEV